jgi:hypothetical protein
MCFIRSFESAFCVIARQQKQEKRITWHNRMPTSTCRHSNREILKDTNIKMFNLKNGPVWGTVSSKAGWGRWRNRVGGWIWYKHCIHMHVNGKMRPAETIPGMGTEEVKGEWWRRWIQVRYIWYIVRTVVKATTYPPAQ